MNIVEALANRIQTLGVATLGQDLFIGRAPDSNIVPDTIWWLIASGGSPLVRNSTGEYTKVYTVLVYSRNRDYKQIYDQMLELEEDLNCSNCAQLEGFDTVDIEATSFPIDNDLDDEDRKVGLLQVTITTYKEC